MVSSVTDSSFACPSKKKSTLHCFEHIHICKDIGPPPDPSTLSGRNVETITAAILDFVAEENSGREQGKGPGNEVEGNHMVIVTSLFSKSSVFKIKRFPST